MRLTFTCLLSLICFFTTAQTIADFEAFEIEQDSFLNGSDGSGGFSSGDVFLPNTFTQFPDFTSWSGWSISNITDTITPGFTNQYSAITGGGVDSSANYAITFVSGESQIQLPTPQQIDGLYITNSTYAYLSMLEGDNFAKKFGGATGDDPDFFLLTIKSYTNGALSTDSIDFYLADFRFEDSSQDFIINEWTFVDLSSFGVVDSLSFTLSSSDVGQFGMNTPAYFCVDNIQTSMLTSVTNVPAEQLFKLYPNPSIDFIQIELLDDRPKQVSIFSIQGQLLETTILRDNTSMDIRHLNQGMYLVLLEDDDFRATQLIVKGR